LEKTKHPEEDYQADSHKDRKENLLGRVVQHIRLTCSPLETDEKRQSQSDEEQSTTANGHGLRQHPDNQESPKSTPLSTIWMPHFKPPSRYVCP
jgi:hypothetical protein